MLQSSPHQCYIKKVNESLDLLGNISFSTLYSNGPLSQGEPAPVQLQELIKTYQQLELVPSNHNVGMKWKSATVQNREVAETIVGLQQSLLGKEDGVRFANQQQTRIEVKMLFNKEIIQLFLL